MDKRFIVLRIVVEFRSLDVFFILDRIQYQDWGDFEHCPSRNVFTRKYTSTYTLALLVDMKYGRNVYHWRGNGVGVGGLISRDLSAYP